MKKLFTLLSISAMLYTDINAQIIWTDSCDFTSNCQYIALDTSNSIWRIGNSTKPFFNGQSGITTLLDSSYPAMNHSYFDILVVDTNTVDFGYDFPNFTLAFDHKFHTDSLLDGMYIEVSYDHGLTFYNVVEDPLTEFPIHIFDFWNGYTVSSADLLYNGEYGFSASSTNHPSSDTNGWLHSELNYTFFLPVAHIADDTWGTPDSMMFRFNFISDNVDNHKEGWMIDNFKFTVYDLGSQVQDIASNKSMILFPNPTSTEIHINTINAGDQISLLSLDGKILQVIQASSDTTLLDVSSLQSGIYFVQVKSKNTSIQIHKFVKN